MDFRTAALGALLLTWALPVNAQPATPDSTSALPLADLLRLAEATNPALRAARLGADAQRRAADAAGRRPDPRASVTAFPEPLVTARGAQRTQWRVEQRMPWPGTLSLRAGAARSGAARAQAESDAYALDLSFQVQRAYIDGARARRQLALLRAFHDRLALFGEAAAARYEVGQGPQAALLQIALERARLEERALQLDAEVAGARHRIGQLLDRPDVLVAFSLDAAAGAVLTGPTDPTQDRRPEVAALDAATDQVDAEVALARKAFYPDLGAAVTYFDIADRSAPPTADGTDAFAVSLSATLPLDRAARRAALEAAQLRQARLSAERAALNAQLVSDAERARTDKSAAEQTLALYREQLLPQADAVVESALSSYTTGAVGYPVVLEAERARFQVLTGHADARARLLLAEARLRRALGLPTLRP